MFEDYFGLVHFIRCEDGAVSEIGNLYRREVDDDFFGLSIPVIKDINGNDVYGYECWWTPFDEELSKKLNG